MDGLKEKIANFRAKLNGKDPNAPEEPKFSENKTFEINLVPEIKYQMLKSMRFRKVSTFVCAIVAAVVGVATAVFGIIVVTQNNTLAQQDTKLDSMAKKISEFSSMDDFLTLQSQLNAIQTVNDNKQVLSRIFGVISMLRPQGGDELTLSKVSVNMDDDVVTMEGQADAGVAPFYDYRVLESFKKGAELTKYDHGRYVDAEGVEIPARCMIEAKPDGSTYMDENGSIYAYQTIGEYGCDTKLKELKDALNSVKENVSVSTETDTKTEIDKETGKEVTTTVTTKTKESELKAQQAQVYSEYGTEVRKNWFDKWLKENNLERYDDYENRQDDIRAAYQAYYDGLSDEEKVIVDTEINAGVDIRDVDFRKIYRTPQFTEWLKEGWTDEDGKTQATPRMTLSGEISDWPHFESQCISYSGEKNTVNGKEVVMWTTTNDCMLLAGDMSILESSNGRNSEGELVLRFRATIDIAKEALSFKTKHLLAIGPDGQNVTDSYRQIEGMFEQEAVDCNTAGVICTEAETAGNNGSGNSENTSGNSGSGNGNNGGNS
ncbi:hypothetical protein IJH19_02175 [Candidatus Saccharibacteria bacterium]|nr:hypothetical protein [Candidatus Saccharibacteria bacterium]